MLAKFAGLQHGVVRLSDLRAAGLNSSAVSKRRARGVLHRQYPGVYSVGHVVLSREGRWLAAVFAGGTGLGSATALWNLVRYAPPVPDVLVPQGRRPVQGINFRQDRHFHPLDATKYRGIPVTTVARTLVDLTDDLTPDELTNLIHEAAYRRRFSLTATYQAIERANGRHNLDRLQQAIEAHLNHSAGTRSRDVDGPGHARPRTQREDRAVDALLHAAGYTVVRLST